MTLSVSLPGALTAPLTVLFGMLLPMRAVAVMVLGAALVVSLVLVPVVLISVLEVAAIVFEVGDFKLVLVLLTMSELSLVKLMFVIDSRVETAHRKI